MEPTSDLSDDETPEQFFAFQLEGQLGYEETIQVQAQPQEVQAGFYVGGTAAVSELEEGSVPPPSQPGIVFGTLTEARLALKADLDRERPQLPRGWYGGRNWNSEYQALREYPTSMPNADLAKSLRIRRLVKEFCESAARVAAIIVREKDQPHHKRQVPPVNLGGIAGGEKFVQDGILFKFAIPTERSRTIFPDDESAMKAANAELRGLSACIEAHIPGVFFPLMCLIDYGLIRANCRRFPTGGQQPAPYQRKHSGSRQCGRRAHAGRPRQVR